MIINNTVGRGGSSGKDGTTPHIGANGNWYLGETDTGVLAKAQGNTEIAEITLLASNWDESLNQTVACEGISKNEADQMVTLLPSLSSKEGYSRCRISCTAFAENSLTFTAESLPAEDITVFVAMEGESVAVANNVYSTEETVVGRWIDGKPIYRKLFFVNMEVSKGVDTVVAGLSELSIDRVVNINGISNFEPNNTHTTTIRPASNRAVAFGVSSDKQSLIVYSEVPIVVEYGVIEYTKTTDAATIAIPSATAMTEAYEEGVNEA